MEFWDKKAVIFEKERGFLEGRGFDVTNMGFWKDGVFKKARGF